MNNRLCTLDEVLAYLQTGKSALLAGTEAQLRQVPKGAWIGGTIPYFVGQDGGQQDTERIFLTELPAPADACIVKTYDVPGLQTLVTDGREGDVTFVILPAFSAVHQEFAVSAPEIPGMYMHPLIGWVAGVDVEEIGKVSPKVFHGPTGEAFADVGVALHMPCPAGTHARIDILNLFSPGDGPVIKFPATGFTVRDCTVDGQPMRLIDYLREHEIDIRLPLVADHLGAIFNSAFSGLNDETGEVSFYGPVFADHEYRLAAPVGDYAKTFTESMDPDVEPLGAFNCVLNYLYGELEGKQVGHIRAAMTFGEIAYQLLTQTLVYVTLEND